MESLGHLESQIRERLSAIQAHTLQAQNAAKEEMAELQVRSARFWEVASQLLEDVIRPRMKLLEALFPNARLTLADGTTTSMCICCFDHTPDFPTSTKLEIGVLPDLANNTAIVSYSLEILPIFFEFDRSDQMVVQLDQMNEESVSSWLDAKLLQFTDTYLQVRTIEQYQQENVTIDPVCGMRVNRADAAASADFGGKQYFFCVEECRLKFLSEPHRYATGAPG